MPDFINKKISEAVDLLCVPASRFKTNEISVNIAMPLKKETASDFALAISAVSRKGRAYPDMTALNVKKDKLYGASLTANIQKVGELQVMKLGVTSLDDRFSFDGERISVSCLELLLSLLFEPLFDENSMFREEDLNAEKRVLLEKIAAEENDKRIYAVRRLEEIMFADEPYGINRFGCAEMIKAATPKSVTDAWKAMLTKGKILVTVVGNIDMPAAEKLIKERFSSVERNYEPVPKTVFVPVADKVNEVCQKENIQQGKLVLGFRVDMKPDDERAAAMRSFCDAFGGGPYSKLFANVREKMSLCYYCSARYVRQKSYIYIQCGCEEENMQKAVDEIINQLEEMKKGNCTSELDSSKIAVGDLLRSVSDMSTGIEAWYSSQIADDKFISPGQSAELNNSVTLDDVVACAKLLSLDTVYRLVSDKEDER